MNRVAHPVPPDEEALDALLGAFFKAEMPATWPAFQAPRPRVLPFRPPAPGRKRRGFFLSSRVVLAASVALLLLAAWLMPRGPLGSPGGLNIKKTSGDADRSGKPTLNQDDGRPIFPDPLPEILPEGAKDDPVPADNVKSSLRLEQKNGSGTIRIDVEELPPDK